MKKAALLLSATVLVLFLAQTIYTHIFIKPSQLIDIKRYGDKEEILWALERYRAKNKSYPDNLTQLTSEYLPSYLKEIPRDPKTGDSYYYLPLSSKNDYRFCIQFELEGYQCWKSGEKTLLHSNPPPSLPPPNLPKGGIPGCLKTDPKCEY